MYDGGGAPAARHLPFPARTGCPFLCPVAYSCLRLPIEEGSGGVRETRGTSRALSAGVLIAGILVVAANLRPVLTSVGPLLDQIGADTGLGVAALGVLAAVPLLAFGAVSPLAHGLSEKFGVERTVFGALLLLVA